MSCDVVIVAARRSPIGKLNGTLSSMSDAALGATVIAGLLADTGVPAEEIDQVIISQVLTDGAGQNRARQASLRAGLPANVPAITANKVCGAGQKSIHLAAQAIQCGDATIIVAGVLS